jgi:hypothetical protein
LCLSPQCSPPNTPSFSYVRGEGGRPKGGLEGEAFHCSAKTRIVDDSFVESEFIFNYREMEALSYLSGVTKCHVDMSGERQRHLNSYGKERLF